eukprot:1031991-Pyramimonas_sp.AAC.1
MLEYDQNTGQLANPNMSIFGDKGFGVDATIKLKEADVGPGAWSSCEGRGRACVAHSVDVCVRGRSVSG